MESKYATDLTGDGKTKTKEDRGWTDTEGIDDRQSMIEGRGSRVEGNHSSGH